MKIARSVLHIVVIATTFLLVSCSSGELTIQIIPKPNADGYDMFYFIDENGKKMFDFGGLTRSTAGLKIDGKDVYSVTVITMSGAHGQKGLYFAFLPEQNPKKEHIGFDKNGNEIVQTIYNGGTMLAAGPMFKFPYKKMGKRLNIITK